VGELSKSHPKAARSPSRPSACITHLKWGIEGFIESAAQEVAPFGIDFIIVEPGPTATNFGAGLVRASPMDVYKDTPVGALRRAIAEGGFAVKATLGAQSMP
jgi:NAD(P)-dependent dehydrogenase (short-subunit alcohol dehydrogenase family)